MPSTPHIEKHFAASATVRDVVIGMADGLTVPFALAAGLFGTFTPFASTWLIEHTGDKASPGLWLMCAAVLGIFGTMTIYRGGRTIATEEAVAT